MSNQIPMAALLMCLCFALASASLGQTAAPMSVEEGSQSVPPSDGPSLHDTPADSVGTPQQEQYMNADGPKPSQFSTGQLLPLVLLLVVVGFAIWTAKRSPASGIAGWLLLPAIGLTLSPLIAVVAIIVDFSAMTKLQVQRMDIDSRSYQASVILGDLNEQEDILRGNIGKNVLMGILALYAVIRMSRKKPNTPRIIVWVLAIHILLSVLLLCACGEVFIKSTILAVISAAIWIPYFLTSKRVKATFAQPKSEQIK